MASSGVGHFSKGAGSKPKATVAAQKAEPAHREINFSPFANNVLDYVGKDNLSTPGGQKVEIDRAGMGFRVKIGGKVVADKQDNLGASFALNMAQVGTRGR